MDAAKNGNLFFFFGEGQQHKIKNRRELSTEHRCGLSGQISHNRQVVCSLEKKKRMRL